MLELTIAFVAVVVELDQAVIRFALSLEDSAIAMVVTAQSV